VAITAKLYGNALLAALNKEIDLIDDNIAVQLHTSAYTPDQDAHDYKNDLSNELPTSGGYTVGGKDLTGKSLTYTPGTNTIMFDAADLQWASSTFTFRTAVILDRSPATDATRPLLGYQNSDADIVVSGGNLDVVWNAAGLISIVVG
jgi:hypothetical protein